MSPSNPNLPIVKGHCPSCGAGRNAEVLKEHTEKWQDDEAGMWGDQGVPVPAHARRRVQKSAASGPNRSRSSSFYLRTRPIVLLCVFIYLV
jgi:hypothetical protein